MYHLSRSIYRELADAIVEDRPDRVGPSNHERVLRACESTVFRLATDRHYFARPSKTLFNDIRIYFPMSAQVRMRSEEHTSELQSHVNLVCRLLLEKKKRSTYTIA